MIAEGMRQVPRPVRLAFLGTQMLFNQGEYDQSIDYGLKALEYAPRDQSTINESSLHLTLGQTYSARLMAALRQTDSPRDSGDDLQEAHRVALHFAAAVNSPDTAPEHKVIIDYTLNHLATFLRSSGLDAEAVDRVLSPILRALEEEEDEDEGENQQMQQLWRQLASASNKEA